MKLRHIDFYQNLVEQDAREVRTKASKSFPTFFFPVGAENRQIVVDWVEFLRTKKLFGYDDPLFPASLVVVGDDGTCDSIEALKAWSMNLGHDELMTTLNSYGTLSRHRQAELMASMSESYQQGS
jgi:hypothetical protein